MLTRNMDLIAEFNWSRIVYEDLREAVLNWHDQKDNPKRGSRGRETNNDSPWVLYGPNGMTDSTLSRLFFFSLFTIVFVLTLNYA